MIKKIISFLDTVTGSKWFFIAGGIFVSLGAMLEYVFFNQDGQFTVWEFAMNVLRLALLILEIY
jgi:hypothetical protein